MRLLAALLTAALALTACGQNAEPTQGEVKGAVAALGLSLDDNPASSDAALAAQRLGWELIQAIEEPNRLTSPSSLSMSLAQVAEGARGHSLESIDAALGLSGDERARAYGALRQSLLEYDSLPDKVDVKKPPKTPVVHQASRVLAVDAEIEQEFLDRLSEYFDAPAASATKNEAKALLDAWVRHHTANLIEESGIEVTHLTRAVIQDALLFAAAWRTPFTDERTIPFHGPEGKGEVDGVSGQIYGSYAQGERWTAVRLPYDNNLAADVILPKEGVAPHELTTDELEEATKALSEAETSPIDVTMPVFDLKSKVDLMKALPRINLENLTGIIPDGTGEQWVQQVVLQVSAKGTVGAAVTEVSAAEGGAMQMDRFDVDRPYVFRVLDTRTSWPLFLAVIADPSA